MAFRYDEVCIEETKGLLNGLFKYCKKKFVADQVSLHNGAAPGFYCSRPLSAGNIYR